MLNGFTVIIILDEIFISKDQSHPVRRAADAVMGYHTVKKIHVLLPGSLSFEVVNMKKDLNSERQLLMQESLERYQNFKGKQASVHN